MRIAVCEDNLSDARLIIDALSSYCDANSLLAEVDCFASGEDFLAAFAPGIFQIIFMDIYMKTGGITGMEAAEKVTATDKDAAVIFVTTSEDHVLEGYNYAVYYVVKPLDDDRIVLAMEKCRLQVERFAKTIRIIVDRHPVRLRLRDIYSIESKGRNCLFRLAAREVSASELPFDGLIERLGEPFVQCHRSYIVNLLYVKESVKNDFVMKDGSFVPVSRTYKTTAQKACREFFWKQVQGDLV